MNKRIVCFISILFIFFASYSFATTYQTYPWTDSQIDLTEIPADTIAATLNRSLLVTKNYIVTSGTITFDSDIVIEGGTFTCSGGKYRFNKSFNAKLTQVFINCIAGDVTGINEAYVEWWGGNPLASAEINTAAINSAISFFTTSWNGTKVKFGLSGIYKHNGFIISNGLTLEGLGQTTTTLNNVSTSNDAITIYSNLGYMSPVIISNLYFASTSTGAVILIDTEANITIEKCYMLNLAGKAIVIGKNSHVSTITIQNNTIQSVVGDAISGRGVSSHQLNAIHIINNSISRSTQDAIHIWGNNVLIENNTIQGNTRYGVYLDGTLDTGWGAAGSASNTVIKGNYFEANDSGHIAIKTTISPVSVLTGVTIENNFGYQDISIIGAGYKAFQIISSSAENEIRDLKYRTNHFGFSSTPTVIADFGGKLNMSSKIEFENTINSSVTVTDTFGTVLAQYSNLGAASLNHVKTLTLHGYFISSGGTTTPLTYTTSILKSDIVISTGAHVYFPVALPFGTFLHRVVVPVQTDSTSYSITFNLQYRKYNSISAYSNLTNTNITGNGSALIEFNILAATSSQRIYALMSDMLLHLTVTLTTPGTYFYLGNPTIIYN